MFLGIHVSISGSIDEAIDRAVELNCTTFQIFTRNPRGWNFKDLDDKNITNFLKKYKKYNFKYSAVHMPYLPNLASPNQETYSKSVSILKSELHRCSLLGIPYLITHLGSHIGKGELFGLKRVIEACSSALSETKNDVMILLENTAGTKNSVGSTFENLQYILKNIEHSNRVGICFDTSHAFAAGYDLRSNEDVDKSLGLLKEIIGFDKVKVIHLNDSKNGFNSHSDRHYHIGLGKIGENGFRAFLNNKFVKTCPIILETPVDSVRSDLENLNKVKELADEPINHFYV